MPNKFSPRSPAIVWLASLLVPPVGIVLVWLRAGTRVRTKVLGSLLIAVWSVAALVLFFGLRMQMDGSGVRPLLGFYRRDAHYAGIERSRARQKLQPVAVAVERPAPAETPARVPAQSAWWTDFRGPKRDGRYDEMPILTDWPAAGLKRLWRQPIGGGYASFVVAQGRAFTIEQRRGQEVVTAYDLATGVEVWAHGWEADFRETMGGDGPRACPTWHQGTVYALGAAGELRAFAADTGKRIWSRNILTDNDAQNLQWGMAAAPLVVDDKVIVLPGGSAGKSVAAYDRRTGEPVWKSLDDKQSYASPMLVTLAGKRQLLVVSARRMMGLTVEEGAVLWQYPWTTEYDINAAQPLVIGDNRVFISAGYGHGSAVVEIARAGTGFEARQIWINNRMKNKFSSSVLHDGYLYGLDESILACISAASGELKWKGGRYGYGQVLLASGHLIVSTESGEIVLVKATPYGHQEVARFSAISGKTWNVPALSDGCLLVRNAEEMACFRIAAK